MAKICPLFSGSSGNSTYISSNGTAILIDAGVSARMLCSSLEERDISPSSLSAIFVTHAHIDHIKGLKNFIKKYRIPVFGSEATLECIASKDALPPDCEAVPFVGSVRVGELSVTAFDTMHDSPGSRGYTVTFANGERAAVCTDLGKVTDTVRREISGCRTVLIESNHDVTRLQTGPYTYDLKKRIASDYGHLSNTACSSELPALVESGAVRFILAHLSRENNLPEAARSAAVGSLLASVIKENIDYALTVAEPSGGRIINI